jgi:GTP-binding protein Era
MMAIVNESLNTADLLYLIIDSSESLGSGDRFVLEMIKKVETPIFLLLNKIDLIHDKTRLLSIIDFYSNEYEFKEIFPISSIKSDGIRSMLAKTFEYLPAGPMQYPEDELTDQPERVLVAELVREKILTQTGQELPHATAVYTERWDESQGSPMINCTIFVEKPSQRAIILGKGGQKIKKIGMLARIEVEKMLRRRCSLFLFVKVREDWRNDPQALDELGIQGE